ncbi:MAG: nitrilase-related carbon-nitrogen hydrolase [Sphingomonadaceae bacterium]
MTIAPFLACAMQLRARSVEAAPDVPAARAGIRKHIADLEIELRGTKDFLEKFSGTPLKLVVLPEYLFTGFPTGRVSDFRARAVFDPDGPEYRELGELARRLSLFIAGNAYESDPHFPTLHFQTSFVVAPSGEVVLRYRRLNSMYTASPHDVWSEYRKHYTLDQVFPVADTEIGRIGAVASEEILYPEIARAMALQGAEILVHSSSEQGGLVPTAKHLARRARALENLAWVVSANTAGIAGGDVAGLSADGNSAIVDFKGQVVAEALSGENANAFAEIDVEAVRRHRRKVGMSNYLARQRLECFREIYAQVVQPADSLIRGGEIVRKAPAHASDSLGKVIAERARRGLI